MVGSLGIKSVALSSGIGSFVLFLVLAEIAQRYYKTITKRWRTYLTLFVIEMIALIDVFHGRTASFYCLLGAAVLFIGITYYREISMILKENTDILKKDIA